MRIGKTAQVRADRRVIFTKDRFVDPKRLLLKLPGQRVITRVAMQTAEPAGTSLQSVVITAV